MNRKTFDKLLSRDGYCLHCGETEALSPNHRANRGMGGSKLLDVPSNIVLLCSWLNSEIESNPYAAATAKLAGWKLERWQTPKEIPVKDLMSGESFLLLDDWTRILFENKETKIADS